MTVNLWTPEQDAALKDMWGRGLSANQCAARLPGRSRNSCIGRAHRLKLDHGTGRSGPVAALTATARAARMARRNEAKKAARRAEQREGRPDRRLAAQPKPEEPPVGAGVRFAELEPRHCKWPLRTKCADGIWKSCGEPRKEASPYCPHHHSRAFAGLRYTAREAQLKPRDNARHFNG